MKRIAIVGTGKVGGTLTRKLAAAGHRIHLGVRDLAKFDNQPLLDLSGVSLHLVAEAVALSEVVILAVPAPAAADASRSLGDTSGKVIIDTMNVVGGRGPEEFSNASDAILANTTSQDLAKCFNTTGFNNMADPQYGDQALDSFVAGDSEKAKQVAMELSADVGFANCYDVGGNDKFELMEQFAWFWINLAMVQGQGREIGFKLLRR